MVLSALLSLSLLLEPVTRDTTAEQLLSRGSELEAAGEYEAALDVWDNAFHELSTPDFRISRAYLRLATEQELDDYYETASSLYFWGLAPNTIIDHKVELLEEINFLSLIHEEGITKKWKEAVESGDPEVVNKIRGFWTRIDPTPGSNYNERLLEHWERISYARANFTRNDNTLLGTDDRGPFYVKYGAPDRKYNGDLRVYSMDIENTCNFLMRCDPDMFVHIVLDLQEVPEYEVWIYDRFVEAPLVGLPLIFGKTTFSEFKRFHVLDDFIPNMSFTFSNRYLHPMRYTPPPLRTASPGMVLQFIYYEKMASLDGFFGQKFQYLENNWVSSPTKAQEMGTYQGPSFNQRASMDTDILLRDAPDEESSENQLIPDIPLRTVHYRFLDAQNRPYLTSFLITEPFTAFIEDLGRNDEILMPNATSTIGQALQWYELKHGIQILTEDGEMVNQSSQVVPVSLSSEEEIPSISVYRVPLAGGASEVVFYSEMHNRHPDTEPVVETVFQNSLRGIGKEVVSELPSLELKDNEPLMADVVFGYGMDTEAASNILFPFIVTHEREVPESEALAIHLEVYNMYQELFRLRVAVTKDRRLQWLRGKEREVSLSLELQSVNGRYIQDLEIQTRELEPGEYTLELEVLDREQKRVAQSSISFSIVEK